MGGYRRLRQISIQLQSAPVVVAAADTALRHPPNVVALRRALRSEEREEIRHQVFDLFAEHPELMPVHGMSKEQQRDLSLRALLMTRGITAAGGKGALELMLDEPALYYEMGHAL